LGVLGADGLVFHQGILNELLQWQPKIFANGEDWKARNLIGLNEGEHFEYFIQGAKTSGK